MRESAVKAERHEFKTMVGMSVLDLLESSAWAKKAKDGFISNVFYFEEKDTRQRRRGNVVVVVGCVASPCGQWVYRRAAND
jgi:hypothetical protein